MDTSLEQNLLIEQIPVTSLETVTVNPMPETVPTTTNINLIPMYLILFVNLLIPILSVEGLVGWSIGMIGAYKTVNIYRNHEKDKNKKALKLLVMNVAIALVYNILVFYVTKIIVAKFA